MVRFDPRFDTEPVVISLSRSAAAAAKTAAGYRTRPSTQWQGMTVEEVTGA